MFKNYIEQLPNEEAQEILELFCEHGAKGMITPYPEWEGSETNQYKVGWACIWNNTQHIGKTVQIAFKNDRVAAVYIDGKLEIDSPYFYRLEDLVAI